MAYNAVCVHGHRQFTTFEYFFEIIAVVRRSFSCHVTLTSLLKILHSVQPSGAHFSSSQTHNFKYTNILISWSSSLSYRITHHLPRLLTLNADRQNYHLKMRFPNSSTGRKTCKDYIVIRI